MHYKMSPSDLTFLFEGCAHCFVLKVKHGIRQPSIPMSPIFTQIGDLQEQLYHGRPTGEVHPDLPLGTIVEVQQWVRSRTLDLPGSASTCQIRGRFDMLARLDDGSYAVIDLKTGTPGEEKSAMYARQLRAYALALEEPEPGYRLFGPVSVLGLLYFSPDTVEQSSPTQLTLQGELQWVPVERDREGFRAFLGSIAALLGGPLPPSEPDTCDWCAYRVLMGTLQAGPGGAEGAAAAELEMPSCPRCGGPMQQKTGRYGTFWSCLRYPECKGTRNV